MTFVFAAKNCLLVENVELFSTSIQFKQQQLKKNFNLPVLVH